MGFLGFLGGKVKQLLGMEEQVIEDKVEEMEEDGYEVTDVTDNEIEIETDKPAEEVVDEYFEEDDSDDVDEPYNIYYYEYITAGDKRVCPACEADGESGTLELWIDPTGSVHAGADEDKIEDWLDYKFSDLVSNPRRDIKLAHRMHEYGGKPSICRCKLTFTGESYSN